MMRPERQASAELVEVFVHLAGGEAATAREVAARASASGDPLAIAVAGALDRQEGGVYEAPAAFEAFIEGGGNRSLYASTARRLRQIVADRAPRSLLDVGCGDGRLTEQLLDVSSFDRLDLCEPSVELLGAATARLAHHGDVIAGHLMGIEELLGHLDRSWDLAMATFSMHSLPPDRRSWVLSRLRQRADTFVLVEFDVPAFSDGSVDHASYAVERYRLGIAEYTDQPLVVSGFLMPVLLRQFTQAGRHTFEQPADAWREDLLRAGFTTVQVERIADYWWAPATLLLAK